MPARNPVERKSPVIEQAGRGLARWQLRGAGCMHLCSHRGRRHAALAELMSGGLFAGGLGMQAATPAP